MNTHYFVGLDIPLATAEQLMTIVRPLRTELPYEKWVEAYDLHMTLAYIGSSTDEQLAAAQAELRAVSFAPFPLTIDGFGTFGLADHPRIFWLRLAENEALLSLRQELYERLLPIYPTLETKPFFPHLTLAKKWLDYEIRLSDIHLPEMQPTTVMIEQTELFIVRPKQQPAYESIASFPGTRPL